MGKRKIPIERIENDQYRMVSFSKRRKGLFNKAQELSTLTGAQTAVLVLSQAGRPYICGSPSFESVVEKFLSDSDQNVGTSMTDRTTATQSINHDGDVVGCSSQNDDVGVSYLNQLLNVDFGECESVEELLALKENLEEMRARVRLALDLQFVQSLFA